MADYERTQAYREKLRNGEFDLGWMQAKSEWGVKATPSKRGLTLNVAGRSRERRLQVGYRMSF